MSTISSFFSNKRTNINKDTEDEPPRKRPTKSGVGNSKTASLRTVTNGQKNLKLTLDTNWTQIQLLRCGAKLFCHFIFLLVAFSILLVKIYATSKKLPVAKKL